MDITSNIGNVNKIDLTENLTVSVVYVSYTYSDYPIGSAPLRHISNQNENDCCEQKILMFLLRYTCKNKISVQYSTHLAFVSIQVTCRNKNYVAQ